MQLLSEKISDVRAYPIPVGINEDGSACYSTMFAIVKWKSGYQNKLHQIYVNEKLAAYTFCSQQRMIIAAVPLSIKYPIKIQVFAIEEQFVSIDLSEQIQKNYCNGRIKIDFARTDNLPLNGSAEYYINGQKAESVKIWQMQNKSGFGLNCFANCDFGFDGASAVGFGKGNFAQGQFGFDAKIISFQTEQLQKGNYQLQVKIVDKNGNQSASQLVEKTVLPPAIAAEELKIEAYEPATKTINFKGI